MRKLTFYMLLLLAGMLSACGDDDNIQDNNQFTVDDARESMSKGATDMSSDIVEITQSEGVEAVGELVTLLQFNDPFNGRVKNEEEAKNWFKQQARLFRSLFVSKPVAQGRTNDHGFDFQNSWGEYNWNPTTKEFEKSDATVQMIIINFPSEGSSTNNIVLRLTDYAEQLFEDEFDHDYMPTLLTADLSIDGTEQIALDFSAQYTGGGKPESGDVSLYLNPFTFSVTFDITGTTQSSGAASISKGDEVIVAVDVLVDFISSEKEDLDKISGFVQYRQIKIEGYIDVDGIINAENPDPNLFTELTLFDGSNKIGDIIFITEMVDGAEEDVPYVEYGDGSRQKLEEILQPVIDELDNFESEVEGWSAD